MTEIRSRPFIEEHVALFKCTEFYEPLYKALLPEMLKLGEKDQVGSHFLDGEILYVSGFAESAPGVAEVFIFPSIHIYHHKKLFFKDVRWWLKYLKQDWRRLQCWGEDTELSKRWLTHLGFLYEGTLHKYTTDGSNMTIWGIWE